MYLFVYFTASTCSAGSVGRQIGGAGDDFEAGIDKFISAIKEVNMTINQQVGMALQGDKNALNEVLKSIREYVYNISVRFLWHPQDAEDATQEILIKVCTNLSQFKGTSAFTTWAYRIAVNHLLN